MFVIVQTGTVFGKGYFVGFYNGIPTFQSCFNKYTKLYKTYADAEKQLARITAKPHGASYSIEAAE